MTSTGARPRYLAAARPPNPAPRTTTRGREPCSAGRSEVIAPQGAERVPARPCSTGEPCVLEFCAPPPHLRSGSGRASRASAGPSACANRARWLRSRIARSRRSATSCCEMCVFFIVRGERVELVREVVHVLLRARPESLVRVRAELVRARVQLPRVALQDDPVGFHVAARLSIASDDGLDFLRPLLVKVNFFANSCGVFRSHERRRVRTGEPGCQSVRVSRRSEHHDATCCDQQSE